MAVSLHGKTVAITGATSGIGAVAALRLAEMGARIVFTARDGARADALQARLKAAGGGDHQVVMADLSVLDEMKRVGAAFAALPRLDVLINNAGALFGRRRESADGLEMTFALNHMAYFVVTMGALARLEAGARIVNVASGAHARARLDFDDLQAMRRYRGFAVYSATKLCNILFTRALTRRLPHGVSANALHPGFVATRFGDGAGGWLGRAVGVAKRLTAISPQDGAKTIMHLAASPDVEGISGGYFYRCRPCAPARQACDDDDAERLWKISAVLAGTST